MAFRTRLGIAETIEVVVGVDAQQTQRQAAPILLVDQPGAAIGAAEAVLLGSGAVAVGVGGLGADPFGIVAAQADRVAPVVADRAGGAGLAQDLGEWVLRECLRQATAWDSAGLPPRSSTA